MKTCWICNKHYGHLSKEHIIPRHFGGIVPTEDFSCEKCNRKIGTIEQKLTPISVLMHNLDNEYGEPTTTIPRRGARNKRTKWSFGDDQQIQLFSDGHVQSDGWERPPGKSTSGDRIWIPGHIPLSLSERDIHQSMLKALMALVCYYDGSKDDFEAPLAYLAGHHDAITDTRPVNLGLAPRQTFARVWIFAPPAATAMTIYGVVTYGPISNIYTLYSGLQPTTSPFVCELKAYSREPTVRTGLEDYNNWWTIVREELTHQDNIAHTYIRGGYRVKHYRDSGLVTLEASPAALSPRVPSLYVPIHPLEPTHGLANRFEHWLRSVFSEEEHAKYLADSRKLDAPYSR